MMQVTKETIRPIIKQKMNDNRKKRDEKTWLKTKMNNNEAKPTKEKLMGKK